MTPANAHRLAALFRTDFDVTANYVARQLNDRELGADLAQQSFAELGELMERTPIRTPQAALRTIVERRIINAIRDRKDEISFNEERDSEPGLGTRGEYHDPTFAPEFDSIVRGLPEAEREVFILTELRGLTVREVEDVTGLSKSSAHRLDAAARTRIRKELAA